MRAAAIADGSQPAAPLAPASTVVLLRDSPSGLEAYVQRRHRGLRFAGGMYAFPGGRIDPADHELPDELWSGPDATAWGRRFGADPAQARAHVVGVVRELFEEAGVLLARPGRQDGRLPDEAARAALAAGQSSLADVLASCGLVLDAEGLTGWARWVTPRLEPRRFDAWFFLASVPDGQEPRVATEESHDGRWVRPSEAVAAVERGDLAMLPPTWWTLRQLADAPSVAAALADPPMMERYTVGWARRGDDVVLVLPDDPDYPGSDPREGT